MGPEKIMARNQTLMDVKTREALTKSLTPSWDWQKVGSRTLIAFDKSHSLSAAIKQSKGK